MEKGEGGEGEAETKVEPAPLQVALLYKILKAQRETYDIQQKILKHMEETTPEGVYVLVWEGTVTPPKKDIDPVTDYPFHRLFKVEIINKGPNTAYARINHETREMTVEVEETILFEKPRSPHIEYITLRVEAETTIKVLGHY